MWKSLVNYWVSNWKTNLAALVSLVYSVPQFVSAVQQWQAGQHPDWRPAIIALVMAAGLAAAKDGDNHSTVQQVEAATVAKAAEVPKP